MIDINITAAIQLVNFLVTLAALNYLLIRPVRETIRKRKELMSGLGREIDGFLEEAQTRLAGYEAALTAARNDASALRKEEKAILARAGREAQASIQAGQASVRAEADAAYAALRKQVPAYADAALARLLG